MPDFAVKTAFTAVDKISPAFKTMSKNANVFGSTGSRAMSKVNSATAGLVSSFKGLLPVLGVGAFLRVGNDAINLASDLQEVQNVVDTTFGGGAKDIESWSKTAISQFGLSELMAKQFAGTFGSMAKSSGLAESEVLKMTKAVVGLSGDYASFRNMEPDQVFEKMQSIITGTTQPLRELGFNMTVATMEAFNLDRGITKSWKSMSQAEQIMTRYNYIMANSKDAQGDFNKTLDESYANQKRVLGIQFDQFLANIAVNILPKLVSVFSELNSWISKIDTKKIANGIEIIVDLVPPLVKGFIAWKAALIGLAMWQGIVTGAGWIIYLSQMLPVLKSAIAAQGFYNTVIKTTAVWQGIVTAATYAFASAQLIAATASWAFGAAITFLTGPIGLTIAAIAGLIAIGYILYKEWDIVSAKVGQFFDFIVDAAPAVGRAILTALLIPTNLAITAIIKLLNIASGIPGIGSYLGTASDKLKSFQEQANAAVGSTNVFAPNQAQQDSQDVRLKGEINITGAPQGTSVKSETRGASPINMNLVGQS